MIRIYYTKSKAVVSDEEQKEYDIVKLSEAQAIHKAIKSVVYPRESLYVIIEVLEGQGFSRVDRKKGK